MSSLFDEMMEEICEKNQKISDLEAKLAEKEDQINWLVEAEFNRKWAKKYVEMRRKEDPMLCLPDSDEVYEKYFELKQQLEEKDESHHKNIVELTKMATEKDRKIEELKQQLFESGLKTLEEIKLSEQRKEMLEDLSTKNWELEQQLAGKNEEIQQWKSMAERSSNLLDRFNRTGEIGVQDKISFAVKKLKETQIYVDNQHFMNARYKCEKKVYADIWNFIDNQIKAIKGEN